jgi:hypothetical protein
MLYERYKTCSKKGKGCRICDSGGQHGPYIHANIKDENGKDKNIYICTVENMGKESVLEKIKKLELMNPGILEEYEMMLSNQDEIEYVEKRIDITEELDEKAYRAGINIQELLIATLEKKTKNIVLEKNWKSNRRRDKKI